MIELAPENQITLTTRIVGVEVVSVRLNVQRVPKTKTESRSLDITLDALGVDGSVLVSGLRLQIPETGETFALVFNADAQAVTEAVHITRHPSPPADALDRIITAYDSVARTGKAKETAVEAQLYTDGFLRFVQGGSETAIAPPAKIEPPALEARSFLRRLLG